MIARARARRVRNFFSRSLSGIRAALASPGAEFRKLLPARRTFRRVSPAGDAPRGETEYRMSRKPRAASSSKKRARVGEGVELTGYLGNVPVFGHSTLLIENSAADRAIAKSSEEMKRVTGNRTFHEIARRLPCIRIQDGGSDC